MSIARLAPPLLALAALTLSACGKGRPADVPEPTHAFRAPVAGDIGPLVQTFADRPGAGPCEKKNLSTMLEIAQAIDANSDLIAQYAASPLTKEEAARLREVQIGPIKAYEPLVPAVPKTDWLVDVSSWDTIIEGYRAKGGKLNQGEWYTLSNKVRAILFDDKDRIVTGYVAYLGHADEVPVRKIAASIAACRKIPGCQVPAFTAEDRVWMNAQPRYASWLADLDSADPAKLANALYYLEMRSRYAVLRFDMHKNNSVRRSGNELVLPIYAGPFADAQTQLAGYVESMWKSDLLHLRIEWMPQSPSIYSLFFGEGLGARSWVNWDDQKVVFYSDIKTTSFAHEFGHVLGFDDHYYTIWDESKCTYRYEYREDDVMSNSSTGHVLESEWQTLLQTYP